MATLREDKKREILDFLEQKADDERILTLELDSIVSRFSGAEFDEEAIKDIIGELEDDDLIVTKRAQMEVVYPASYRDSVEERFSHLFSQSSTFGAFALGFVMYLLLLEWKPFFSIVTSDGLTQTQAASRYALFGIIFAYSIGRITIWGYTEAQSRISVLRQYRALIYPSVVIGVASSGIVFAFIV